MGLYILLAELEAGKRYRHLMHPPPTAPVKWWRVEGKEKKEGDSGRLALGKVTFGKEMAFGKNARI